MALDLKRWASWACSYNYRVLYILLFLFSLIIFFNANTSNVSGISSNCWQYTDSLNSSCNSTNGCLYKSSPWGSWCEELNCWSLYTQSACLTTGVPNRNCTWQTGQTYSWCESVNCWSYSGTNESRCVNNSLNLNCNWRNECYNTGGSAYANCWSYGTEATCENVTGCSWGGCNTKSCWDYSSESTCNGKTGYEGSNCTWNSQYNYCYERSCWDYSNETTCNSALSNLNCKWNYGYCSKKYCSDFGSYNQSYCVNNTANLSCNWNTQFNYCEEKGCWNHAQTQCEQAKNCEWKTYQPSGWCNEVNCWTWDSWSGGNQSACVNNTYGLSCSWTGNPSGNTTNGWCYKDNSKTSCANLTSEKQCIDTYYCWWQYADWNNITAGGQCKSPGDWNTGTNTSISNDWNPGCYIFDLNSTDCNNVIGCNYSVGQCVTLYSNITADGLSCGYINDSTLCNKIPALSSCCSWQGNACQADREITSCKDQVDAPPEGANFCEDYNSYSSITLCEKIAGYPWYMPCEWDNSTELCKFKATDVWGNESHNLIKLENKKSCEAAGGSWISENYCEGNISVPTGRCESKFSDEKNCNRACFACEYKSDGTAHNSSANAKTTCQNSKLGFCEFVSDTRASNGYGYCKAKDEFKENRAGNCDTDCGSCTFKGDPNAAEEKNTPRFYCEEKKSGKPECKWVADPQFPTDIAKGYCASNAEKTCTERCDKCYTQDACGTRSGNCTWDSALLLCKSSSGAGQMEICWDGSDNDDNGKTDCADSKCYSDSFCGGGSMTGQKDCFIYTANSTCTTNNCSWVSETWGSWCDMPGANCWKYDGEENTCRTNNATCDWHSGSGGFCEQNWTVTESCMNHNYTTCTNADNQAKNCAWVPNKWCSEAGGWCESNSSYTGTWVDCWQLYGSGTPNRAGCQANAACKWQEDTWCASQGSNPGYCDHKSFSCWQYNSNLTCTNSTNAQWCEWQTDYYSLEGGWCNGKGTTSAVTTGGSCWDNTNSTNCQNAGCIWTSGFCDPKGFGDVYYGSIGGEAVGGYGISCYKYDGNQSGCQNQTGCGWMTNNFPTCQVDYSADCPKYYYNASLCNQQSACTWKNDSYNPSAGWCDNKAFSVCQNSTNANNQTNCNAAPICYWTSYGCQPACFNSTYTASSSCTALNLTGGTDGTQKLCSWNTGWCNQAGSAQMFNEVEEGAPVMLGFDAVGDATPSSIDIIGYGMKDMKDAYGFGIGVVDFRNSSLCNGVKLTDGYGKGTDLNRFYFYLDTDGRATGNCALKHNSSAVGYEFYFRYEGSFSNTTGQTVETFNAYKCVEGSWGPADIKLSSWNEMMCNEIHGGMIAVSKDDLKKYSDLYNSSADLRIAVATSSSTTNVTNPADTAAVSWTTPGSIDFEIHDAFQYGADSASMAKYEDILKKGYVAYEDCYNSIDDDNNGKTDCYDYGCQYSDKCSSSGVNAASYVDTKSPEIKGVMIEEYPDGASVMFETTKPTNGTLFFWHNDSRCQSTGLNRTIYSRELLSANLRDYALFHKVDIYNGTNSLNYNLNNLTSYYYKIQVCDSAGKCAQSKCTSFVTSSASKCAYCNLVARIKAPNNWSIAYDVNGDNVYEHAQGKVCGPNAGMKINYTQGRRVNILLNKSDGSTYIEFLNATFTKSALNDKVRTISDSGDIISTSEIVGLPAETRDKIVNNMHPEVCRIKIPFSGTCNALFHCDDNGANCVDKTSDATLIDSTNCVWQIPNCEFSTYREAEPSSGSPSPSSGGGGGGGGGAVPVIVADASEKNVASFKTNVFAKIEQGATPIATVDKPEIAISEIKFEAAKSLSNVEIKVSSLKDKPTVMPAAEKVYQYLEITPKNLKSTDVSKVTITFKVTKYWLGANGFKESDVVLSRYASNIWTELPTTAVKSDADGVTFSAETPGFSYFAIVSKATKAEPKEPEIKQQESQQQKQEATEQQTASSEKVLPDKLAVTKKESVFSRLFEGNNIIWTTIVSGVIVLLGLYFYPHQKVK